MSSILDALKKLEEEKAEAARAATIEFDDDSGEQDLVRGGKRRQMTIQYSPASLAAALAVMLALGIGAYYVMKTRGSSELAMARPTAPAASAQPPAPVAPAANTSTTAPVPAAPAPAAPVSAPVPPPAPAPVATPPAELARATAKPSAAAPGTGERAPDVVKEISPAAPALSTRMAKAPVIAEPEPRISEPVKPSAATARALAKNSAVKAASKEAVEELPEPTKEVRAAAPAPAAVKTTASTETLDMYSLPILTESDKTRLGLKGMEVNMLRSPNKNRPSPSAIINMQPVYVNEVIEGTKAKLIGVDVRGIAIEIGGERYFVRR